MKKKFGRIKKNRANEKFFGQVKKSLVQIKRKNSQPIIYIHGPARNGQVKKNNYPSGK